MGLARQFFKYRFLLRELVKKDIKLKYRRSYLGIIWTLIEPIFETIILVMVFGTLFGNTDPTFPLYIVIGRLLYSFFSSGTKAAEKSIRSNIGMINKVYVPKYMYPFSSLVSNFVMFCISLVVLIGVYLYCQLIPTWYMLYFIPAIAILFILTLGIGLILATFNAFFRDIDYIWNVFSMLLMYMSAIFYKPERLLNSNYGFILKYNPVFQIINMARNAILGQPFELWGFLYSLIFSIVALLIGMLIFWRKKDKFILHI